MEVEIDQVLIRTQNMINQIPDDLEAILILSWACHGPKSVLVHCLASSLSTPINSLACSAATTNMLVCDSCGKDFTSEQSLATHKSQNNCKGPKVRYQVIS